MKLIVSTFLVYKVKKCLLKSGKVIKRLVAFIASLWHNIAPYQGNNLPLPGTKRYVGSFFIKKHHSSFYSSLFTKSAETPINTGVARGEELRCPFTTLHPCKFLIYRHLWSSGEEWRVFLKVAYYSGGLQISRNAWRGQISRNANASPLGVPPYLKSGVKNVLTYLGVPNSMSARDTYEWTWT